MRRGVDPTTRRRRAARAFLTVLVMIALLGGTAEPSSAGGGHRNKRGSCSGPSSWELDVQRDDGRLRVRFEIRGGKSGQKWNLFLSDNGVGFFAGSRISESNGHVEVRRRTRDRAGDDRIRAGGNNTATGETCRGRLTI